MSNRNINCPLHGFITLTPRMCQIIDTPEWKRLHNLRQLGVAYIVYPSANQTRAEHSLGVSHLGKLLATSLQQNQPELEISDNDIELIQIAGLVHDIGHACFSHFFDHFRGSRVLFWNILEGLGRILAHLELIWPKGSPDIAGYCGPKRPKPVYLNGRGF